MRPKTFDESETRTLLFRSCRTPVHSSFLGSFNILSKDKSTVFAGVQDHGSFSICCPQVVVKPVFLPRYPLVRSLGDARTIRIKDTFVLEKNASNADLCDEMFSKAAYYQYECRNHETAASVCLQKAH